jgi:CPA1 family monovalent cation:H+ antiporter
MELFLLVLVLLALIGVSNVLNRIVPSVPVPLFQIALGVLLVLLPTHIELELEPELFFVLFIAPLLFNDGRRTRREELWKLRGWILLLAVGLVFVTVIGVGYSIHWMLPSIPLSAAFALAAILSPTDAVAVSALSGRINLPKGIMHLLEGEALMNDASGLVAFKFAVAATVTGVFSLASASWSFIVISLGGVFVGLFLSWVVLGIRAVIRRLGIEDATMHMLIQILTPFFIYILAEHLGVSGILAVVAAGILHSVAKDNFEPYATKLQVVSASTWSVILFILNGLVFILLGLQIPHVVEVIFEDPRFNNAQVIGYVLLITLALYVLRFLWVLFFSLLEKESRLTKQRLHAAVLTTISGVRGAVTLAGAFSIPLALQDGSPFPERDLIIFLSAGVILMTLVVASVLLPLLSGKKEGEGAGVKHLTERQAQIRILEMTIESLKHEMTEENREVILSVIGNYGQKLRQIDANHGFADGRAMQADIRGNWLLAIRAEREEAARLAERGEVPAELAKQLDDNLSKMESALVNPAVRLFRILRSTNRWWKQIRSEEGRRRSAGYVNAMRELRLKTSQAAIRKLRLHLSEVDNPAGTVFMIQHYEDNVRRLSSRPNASGKEADEKFLREKTEWEQRAIQMERDALQKLYENGEVTMGMMNNLRFFINTMEAGFTEDMV